MRGVATRSDKSKEQRAQSYVLLGRGEGEKALARTASVRPAKNRHIICLSHFAIASLESRMYSLLATMPAPPLFPCALAPPALGPLSHACLHSPFIPAAMQGDGCQGIVRAGRPACARWLRVFAVLGLSLRRLESRLHVNFFVL